MEKQTVLFLCTGNSARSQMAEAFLRYFGSAQFEAYSAGLDPKGIHPYTRQVMAEIGLDLEDQYSKGVGEYLGKINFTYLITVCAQAEKNCPTAFLGFGQRLHWCFEDPAAVEGTEEEKLAQFRVVRDQIGQRVQDWLGE
jgi:arsenate reductase